MIINISATECMGDICLWQFEMYKFENTVSSARNQWFRPIKANSWFWKKTSRLVAISFQGNTPANGHVEFPLRLR